MTSGINEANRFDRTRVPPPAPETRIVGDGYAPGTDALLHFTVQGRDGKRITAWRQGTVWSASPEPRSIDEIAAEPAPAAAEYDHEREQGHVYASELDAISKLLEAVHPIGKVKGIGRMECSEALRKVLTSPDPGCFAGGDAGNEDTVRSAAIRLHNCEWSEQSPADASTVGYCYLRLLRVNEVLRSELADLNRLLADFRADVTRRVPLGEPVAEARVKELEAKLSNLPKSMAQLFDERDALTAKLADAERRASKESAIVDRVWKALGIANYEQAGGLSIDQHVTRLKERAEALSFLIRDTAANCLSAPEILFDTPEAAADKLTAGWDGLTARLADESKKFRIAYIAWRERVLKLNSGLFILPGESQEEYEAWLSRAEWGNADDEVTELRDRVAALRGALENLTAQLSDAIQWPWTRSISKRRAADVVLATMVEVGLIEGWQHPNTLGGTGYSTYRINGRLYGRTDEPNGAPAALAPEAPNGN